MKGQNQTTNRQFCCRILCQIRTLRFCKHRGRVKSLSQKIIGGKDKKKRGKGHPKRMGKSHKEAGGKFKNGLRKSGPNIGNPYQIEDNKTQGGGAEGAAPLGRRRRRRCCLRFGKDLLCFCMISGAHSWISPLFFSGICPSFWGAFPPFFFFFVFPPSFFWERLFPLLFSF